MTPKVSKPDSSTDVQPTIQRLKTKPFERNLALAKLGFGAGAKLAMHSLGTVFRGDVSRTDADRRFYSEQAEILVRELGQLKGSVMKAGQMLALFGDYFMPHEAVQVLSSLQDNTPSVAWHQVQPQLAAALSPERLAELEIDHVPLAAASLGQAHRARRKSDGLELVVKIQYPGVASAIDSDIQTLSKMIAASNLAPKNFDLKPIFAEVREMLLGECDYQREADFTEEFARRLADNPRYVVPKVLREYSGACVLTTTYESGVSAQDHQIAELSQDRRNQLGEAFAQLFLTEFFDWGMVQTDPHFGNYRIRIDEQGDRLVLLDFGATRHFSKQFIADYADIVLGARDSNAEKIRKGATAIGLLSPDFPEPAFNAFANMCVQIMEPFEPSRAPPHLRNNEGDYCFGKSDLPMRASQMAALNALSLSFKMPPREIVFLHRRLGGVFIALATLHAELNLSTRLAQSLLHIGVDSPLR